MRNLEDPRVAAAVDQVTTVLQRDLGYNVKLTLKAAVNAYMEATKHPGSLVRIHVATADELEVFAHLDAMDAKRGDIDWVKSSDANVKIEDPKVFLIVEFKNGSAIEMVAKGKCA